MIDPHVMGATTLMRDANTLIRRGSKALSEMDIAAAEHFFAIARKHIQRAGGVLARIKDPAMRAAAGKQYAKAVKAWNKLSSRGGAGALSGLGQGPLPADTQRMVMLGVAAFVGYKLLSGSVNMGTLLLLGGGALLFYNKAQGEQLPPPPKEVQRGTFAGILGQAQRLAGSVR